MPSYSKENDIVFGRESAVIACMGLPNKALSNQHSTIHVGTTMLWPVGPIVSPLQKGVACIFTSVEFRQSCRPYKY